jgi:hypothetical protein
LCLIANVMLSLLPDRVAGANRSLFLAAFNPNYSTQIVALSTVLK